MASFETQPGNALARSQDKTTVRGLVIEFHEPAGMCLCAICAFFHKPWKPEWRGDRRLQRIKLMRYIDCQSFWTEFMMKETTFQLDLGLHEDMSQNSGLGLDFGSLSPS